MNDDDLTTDLGRELHGRSDAMHGSSLALADVQRRARSIRRRRTATAVGGAVAAVALIVPTAALASHQGHRTAPLPRRRRTSRPPRSPTTRRGQQPPTGVLDVSRPVHGRRRRRSTTSTDGALHQTDGEHRRRRARTRPYQFVRAGRRVDRLADRATDGSRYVEIQ